MRSCPESPGVRHQPPTDEELEEARKALGIKRSNQRRVPKNLVDRLKSLEPIEESRLCGK